MADPKQFTKEQMSQLTKVFNPTREEVMINPLNRLAAQTELFDKQRKSFAEAGYARDMEQLGDSFSTAAEESLRLFGNINRAETALDAFSKSSKGFVYMGEEFRQNILKMTVAMQGLGFEATTLAEVVDSSMYAFGQSGDTIRGLMDEFANMSRQLAIPGDTLAQNFRTAQKDFAYTAETFKQNFRDLQVMSRETGLSFESLTGTFGKSFDSFEGAAQKAGQLNQILGRSAFNSIELLNMTEAERAKAIKQQFAGRDANQMGKFELLAIQDTLGFSSVEDTRKFLRTGKMPGAVDKEKYNELDKGIDNIKKGGDQVSSQLGTLSDDIRRNRGSIENAMVSFGNAIQERTDQIGASKIAIKKALEATKVQLTQSQERKLDELNTMQKTYVATLIAKAGANKDIQKAILENINPDNLTGVDRAKIGLAAKDMVPTVLEKTDELLKELKVARKSGDAEKIKEAEGKAMTSLLGFSVAATTALKLGGFAEGLTGIPKAITAIAGLEIAAQKLDDATITKFKENVSAIGESLKVMMGGIAQISGTSLENQEKIQELINRHGPKSTPGTTPGK